MTHGAEFFAAAADAMRRSGRPALMVSADRSVLPTRLPEGVWHLPFAPFGWLFERASVVVHHGGIGTAGRALEAGVPQLVVPSGFDQFDNAARIERLGVGRSLSRREVGGPRLEAEISALLGDERIRARCTEVRERLSGTDPLHEACAAIEGLLVGGGGTAPVHPR
jgi:UDP:flavonoid glycosyltransferase YjiC (YdhE family)